MSTFLSSFYFTWTPIWMLKRQGGGGGAGGGEFVGYCYSVIREFAAHELTSFLWGGELRLGGGGFQGISLYETLSYIFSGIKDVIQYGEGGTNLTYAI